MYGARGFAFVFGTVHKAPVCAPKCDAGVAAFTGQDTLLHQVERGGALLTISLCQALNTPCLSVLRSASCSRF
ncbi:hypothetical protein XENTR_v10018316 [Xenopus tropicalis]|nr:hypothetical protein XENTR_v10018316 [Xenopus tropicalis]